MTGVLDIKENGKAKILLLTGFLGSGKTTLMKRILSWETDLSGTVVLVNEFGKVGIDGTLLKKAGSDVIELTSGCICCTIKTELAQTLKDICDRFSPKRILLEATGVAEPDAVASVLEDEDLKQRMEIQKIITVLDIKFWIGREVFGPFFMHQIKQANIILLNKIDTVDENKVAESLKEMREVIPECHTISTSYCKVNPEILWTEEHKRISGIELLDSYLPVHIPEDEHGHPHHSHDEIHDRHDADGHGFIAFDFCENKPLDEACFKGFLEMAPWELFRIKGPVRFHNRTVLLNFVSGKSEWEPWDGEQATRMAFVGLGVNGDDVIKRLKRCVLPE